jgi:uncharacterized membrane protein YfcA
MLLQYLGVLIIGIMVGFLGGLFGKGGSAIATPLLNLIGIPGFVSVAAPLPATIPGTFIATVEYSKSRLVDREIVRISLIAGIPATIAGAFFTGFTGSVPLLILTGILVLAFGLSFILSKKKNEIDETEEANLDARPSYWQLRLVLVSIFVGLISGLLANSGGFLLAPSYYRFLRLPIKKAFACSLFVSMFLAIPGTIVHAVMGHIDWIVTAVLATGSVPFSMLGAKTAIRSDSTRLEFWYGLLLTVLGAFFLLKMFFPGIA